MTNYDDEFDIRPYIEVILKKWWVILLCVLIPAVIALMISWQSPNTFRSTATLLQVPNRPALALADQFPTVNEPIDSRSRTDAILAILQSDSMKAQVLSKLGLNSSSEYTFDREIQFTSEGDAILITAVLDDPQRAADLANAWAEEASTTINLVYSGEQPLSVIKEQQSVARTAYEAAQELLERFLSDNRILLLENRLLEESEIVGILTSNRSNLVAYFENRQRELNTFIVEAEALKRQVETGSRSTAGSVGDSLAVLFSRASAMGILTEQQTSKMTPEGVPTISSNPVHGFTLDLSQLELLEGSTADLAFDLDTLIEEAKRELELAEESLINLVNDPQESEDGEILETSSANIQSIQTALENQKARLLELTSERDTAWEAYYALTQKEIELINSSQTTDIVTLVAPAVPPAESLANSTAINVVAAAGFGLILGVFVVLGRTWWKGSN